MRALARLLAALSVLVDLVELWWRAVRMPAWVAPIVADLDAEQPA